MTKECECAAHSAAECCCGAWDEPKRTWIGLNWDDLPEIYVGNKAFMHGAKWAEATLKDKNT